ncbi:MAG: MmgE/PrpD family protein [Betaproteobacteria bacterium]|nr:MmgE/PrpD family protein [Betaproteobacteria bacterium]
MSGDEISAAVAAHVSGARFEDLPQAAIAAARRSTLDTLAAMLGGSSAEGLDAVLDLARTWGGAPEARVIGLGQGLPAPLAAWCHGVMARALEIDDCVDFLPVHPSASAVPALLALADARGGMSGQEFVTALAVGQDLKIRLGLAVRQNAMQSGRNNLFKIFGPAAAVARALRLDPRRTQYALGIAFSHAVGDGQCALEGALSLRLQQGIVAQGALVSGLLAERGFTGAQDFLLGRWGYLRVFEPDPKLEALTEGLGKQFLGERISLKPFASCRATHAAIDLARQLRDELGGALSAIESIELTVSPEVERLVGAPREARIRPSSSADAQFSLQYTVAAALARGQVFLAEMEAPAYTDPALLALAAKVKVVADPQMRTELVIGRTRLTASLQSRNAWQRETALPLGAPQNALGPEALRGKLAACAERARRSVSPEALDALCQQVATLERLPDVRVLLDALY